jgi:hypothetical protein
MKKIILLTVFGVLLLTTYSCKKNNNSNAFEFRTGTFEIPAGDKYTKTVIIRKDSLQIEHYQNRIDTLIIDWKNNFKYTLKMLSPKSELDKKPIHVKITNIKENGYDFIAKIGYSKFEQKGTLIKTSK